MITNSFIFLDRVSHALEQGFWRAGITDWDAFIGAEKVPGLSPKRKHYFSRRLAEARTHLDMHDSAYFAERFPKSEAWRMYDHFSDDCLFLDIETSGCYGDITVVGMYDGSEVITLVKNRNLDKESLQRIISGYRMLVTFNGLPFDVPVINRCFNRVVHSIPHLDLRFPLMKIGFTGGLKKIEKELGIVRSRDAEGMSGEDAVHLWHDYAMTGSTDALNLLVEYNTADVVNLKPIADFVFAEMKKKAERFFA